MLTRHNFSDGKYELEVQLRAEISQKTIIKQIPHSGQFSSGKNLDVQLLPTVKTYRTDHLHRLSQRCQLGLRVRHRHSSREHSIDQFYHRSQAASSLTIR